jgi:hypothetical protein
VSDNLSGVVGSTSYTELYGYGLGTFTGDNCPAPKDNAGNVGNQYLFGPLTVNTYCTGANFKINPPIDSDGAQLSRGKTVPVKFGGLCGDESRASGFDTTGWTIATEKVNCTTHADIASYATPSGTNAKYFRYDQSADQYIYNADFHSGPYAVGDCLQVRVNIGGGAPTLASRYFKLVK